VDGEDKEIRLIKFSSEDESKSQVSSDPSDVASQKSHETGHAQYV
jgi:hypothetical protein